MLEQPTPADDLDSLRQVTRRSPVPILADESVKGPSSALEIASRRAAHGLNVKLVTCGGVHRGRQIDAIARAARMAVQPLVAWDASMNRRCSSPLDWAWP